MQCYYVGVRSREASAAPGPASAEPSARERGGASAPPRACDEVVTLRMTETGPVVAFKEDVELCPGCWLVGGRDGVLFSWKHRDAARFAMARAVRRRRGVRRRAVRIALIDARRPRRFAFWRRSGDAGRRAVVAEKHETTPEKKRRRDAATRRAPPRRVPKRAR